MPEVIRAEQLTKNYGSNRGIVDVDFTVESGETFGYLGPNGAGKSTTIRLLLDLIRPTSGRLTIFGLDSRRNSVEIRKRMGYLPGDLRLYERMTGRDLLEFFRHLRGVRGHGAQIAERLDLDLDREIKELSRGNRQKVGIVQAFMHDPDLVVLDEPTSGLDPLVQETFYELVAEVTERGGTVFLSSHVLSEVQHLAHRVGLIREGRLDLVDSVENLRAAFTHVEATFAGLPPTGAFDGVPGVRRVEQDGDVVRFAFEGEIDPLLKALAKFHVKALDVREADLEDVFLARYRGEEPGAP